MKKQVKNLSIFQKISLSIYPFFNICYFIEYIYLSKIPLENYKFISFVLLLFTIVQIIFLVNRLNFLNINPDKKFLYVFLFLSIVLFHIYYIWIQDDNIVSQKQEIR